MGDYRPVAARCFISTSVRDLPRVCCSTAAAEVKGQLADEARSRGEHIQGQIDGGDSTRDVASDQPGQELRDPLLGSNTRTDSDLAATVEGLKARLIEQETQFETLSKRLGVTHRHVYRSLPPFLSHVLDWPRF